MQRQRRIARRDLRLEEHALAGDLCKLLLVVDYGGPEVEKLHLDLMHLSRAASRSASSASHAFARFRISSRNACRSAHARLRSAPTASTIDRRTSIIRRP